jgi:hypothetical protein
MSNGQPVGSLIIMDSLIANTPVGIKTSLLAENSTALLVQNTGFFNVQEAIVDVVSSSTLMNGGNEVLVDNWGFGTFISIHFWDSRWKPGSCKPFSLEHLLVGERPLPNLFYSLCIL